MNVDSQHLSLVAIVGNAIKNVAEDMSRVFVRPAAGTTPAAPPGFRSHQQTMYDRNDVMGGFNADVQQTASRPMPAMPVGDVAGSPSFSRQVQLFLNYIDVDLSEHIAKRT